MENKPDEITATEEDRQYKTFSIDGFKIKTGVEALDNFKEKIKGKTGTEDKMKAWVQGKLRLSDPKKPVKEGEFDKACKLLLDYIFKAEMQEAKKQRKLTDGFSTINIPGIDTKEKADAVAKVVMEGMERKVQKFKDRKNKEAVSLAFKIATSARKDTAYCSADKPMPIMTAARCQKCHGPHKIGARHKFEPAARGRGRPARRG